MLFRPFTNRQKSTSWFRTNSSTLLQSPRHWSHWTHRTPSARILNRQVGWCGGLAVICRNSLLVTRVLLKVTTTTFEVLVAKVISGVERFLIVNVDEITPFLDELSDLEDTLVSSGFHPILIGDFNCPGASSNAADQQLSTRMSCFIVTEVNDDPTGMTSDGGVSRLDLIIEFEHTRRLSWVSTVMIVHSDHWLVRAQLDWARPAASTSLPAKLPRSIYNICASQHSFKPHVSEKKPEIDIGYNDILSNINGYLPKF